jgi:SAM-dependent methyltransferase
MNTNNYSKIDEAKKWSKWKPIEENFLINLLKKLPIKKGDFLDLGCGQGFSTQFFKEAGFNSRGLEYDNVLVKGSQKRGLNVIQGDLNKKLPFKTSSFDVILLKDAIEHLPSAYFIMKEMKRVLRPNGYLIIATCDIASLKEDFWNNPDHKRPYSMQTLKFLYNQYDYETVASYKQEAYLMYFRTILIDWLKWNKLYFALMNFFPSSHWIVIIGKNKK